ncbi:hypothetical protein K492DRAFT_171774 [Lichtheimia hyalospora FSU 10163]|nr:hypothetical protein K492DRAFT_171774 [Lichtheimia hyalospora FSU 10163]
MIADQHVSSLEVPSCSKLIPFGVCLVYSVELIAGIVEATVKTTTSTRPLDGSVQQGSDLVVSRYSKIYGCDCQIHFNALDNSYQELASFIATGGVIGAIPIFLLVDINSSSTCTDALDVLSYVNIFVCTIWPRPGLFVPALFVMHDVSLTPTKKVA